MKTSSRYPNLLINMLLAVVISVVVNFSTLLALLLERYSDQQQTSQLNVQTIAGEGVLHVHPNGFGFLVYPSQDSVYVAAQRIRHWHLTEGDCLAVNVIHRRKAANAYPMLFEIRTKNGAEFSSPDLFTGVSMWLDLGVQLVFYALMSFVLLVILTRPRHNFTTAVYIRRCVVVLILGVALYWLAPSSNYHNGRILPTFLMGRWMNFLPLMKCSFTVVVTLLYGRIYLLLAQRQAVVVENEQLKNENLTTRYNMLVGQINPHFFFNSLNSLAMLVREAEKDKALEYIDQLSYTFRYIIQNGQSTLMTLEEELHFADAFEYLYKIRYEDKLFFDTEVDPEYLSWRLPALSLQPLLGNAVKHNVMTRQKPLHVKIRTERGQLVISNPKYPKLEEETSTKIGLDNLRNRWRLIVGCEIEIRDLADRFEVRLPLQQPNA